MTRELILGSASQQRQLPRRLYRTRVRPRITRNFFYNLIACLTIFPSGFNHALPGTDSGASWAAPYEVVHGIFIHNVMTLILLGAAIVMLFTDILRTTISPRAWRYAGLIAALALVGLISTIANWGRFSTTADFGEMARIFLPLLRAWNSAVGRASESCFPVRCLG